MGLRFTWNNCYVVLPLKYLWLRLLRICYNINVCKHNAQTFNQTLNIFKYIESIEESRVFTIPSMRCDNCDSLTIGWSDAGNVIWTANWGRLFAMWPLRLCVVYVLLSCINCPEVIHKLSKWDHYVHRFCSYVDCNYFRFIAVCVCKWGVCAVKRLYLRKN